VTSGATDEYNIAAGEERPAAKQAAKRYLIKPGRSVARPSFQNPSAFRAKEEGPDVQGPHLRKSWAKKQERAEFVRPVKTHRPERFSGMPLAGIDRRAGSGGRTRWNCP